MAPRIATAREPDAAGRARARVGAVVVAGRRGDDVGPVRERRVELAHLVGVGALLRAVDGGCALRPGQRVVDVAGDLDARRGQPRMQAG